jgi:hypothetical protein
MLRLMTHARMVCISSAMASAEALEQLFQTTVGNLRSWEGELDSLGKAARAYSMHLRQCTQSALVFIDALQTMTMTVSVCVHVSPARGC